MMSDSESQVPAPIEQIARDAAHIELTISTIHEAYIKGDTMTALIVLREALRQACGQQTAVADVQLRDCLENLWPFVQSYINDHMHPHSTMNNMARMWVGRAQELLSTTIDARETPAGYKLVPIEPTDAMIDAGYKAAAFPRDREICKAMFTAMIAAAPTPPVQQPATTAAQLALEELGRFAMVWRNSDIYVHPILSREEAVKRGCADLMDAVDKYASLVCVVAAPHPVRGGEP